MTCDEFGDEVSSVAEWSGLHELESGVNCECHRSGARDAPGAVYEGGRCAGPPVVDGIRETLASIEQRVTAAAWDVNPASVDAVIDAKGVQDGLVGKVQARGMGGELDEVQVAVSDGKVSAREPLADRSKWAIGGVAHAEAARCRVEAVAWGWERVPHPIGGVLAIDPPPSIGDPLGSQVVGTIWRKRGQD
ncbi:MAG: hypothetical protein M3083_13820 [Actinomycetota bacterium]|nr:hypothetical protein [Actinomycetota bacterium]